MIGLAVLNTDISVMMPARNKHAAKKHKRGNGFSFHFNSLNDESIAVAIQYSMEEVGSVVEEE